MDRQKHLFVEFRADQVRCHVVRPDHGSCPGFKLCFGKRNRQRRKRLDGFLCFIRLQHGVNQQILHSPEMIGQGPRPDDLADDRHLLPVPLPEYPDGFQQLPQLSFLKDAGRNRRVFDAFQPHAFHLRHIERVAPVHIHAERRSLQMDGKIGSDAVKAEQFMPGRRQISDSKGIRVRRREESPRALHGGDGRD